MTEAALPVASPPSRHEPLAELPALAIADPREDVRGWEIRSDDGTRLGMVSDLVADPDRLVSEFLLVSSAAASGVQVFVPVTALSRRGTHLVPGRGLEPIKLRYVSTLRLTTIAAAVAGVLVLVLSLRTFAC